MSPLFPRCQVIPQANHEVSFLIDGKERTRWHYGTSYPRPFFYPIVGPTGSTLTRMGHPGAPDHDHHRSVWFAHMSVVGVSFWGDTSPGRIRQKEWLAYQDGDDEAVMGARLQWFDGHDPQPLLEQEVVAALRPMDDGEFALELQSTFTPAAELLEFGKTNFGFLAVRVAKNLSAKYGGGKLTGSTGGVGEKELFERPAAWMDYSGPVPGLSDDSTETFEGITYFDHVSNPNTSPSAGIKPVSWHVRNDGWMGAAPGMHGPLMTQKKSPLRLRYLLHIHHGAIDPAKAKAVATDFNSRPPFVVQAKKTPGYWYTISREPA